jgi:uroporphyrinogen-III synthase
MRALAELGVASAPVAAIATVPMDPTPLRDALADLPSGAWVVVTSPTGARIAGAAASHLGRDDLRWAAVGEATAIQLVRAGRTGIWTPTRPDGRAIADELPVGPGAPVLVLRGDLADPELPVTLERRGAVVHEVTAYRTVEAPGSSRPRLIEALRRDPAAVVLASGSAVRGLLALAGPAADALRHLPALCIGATTAMVAREAGFRDVHVARRPSDEALAELTAATVALRP